MKWPPLHSTASSAVLEAFIAIVQVLSDKSADVPFEKDVY